MDVLLGSDILTNTIGVENLLKASVFGVFVFL